MLERTDELVRLELTTTATLEEVVETVVEFEEGAIDDLSADELLEDFTELGVDKVWLDDVGVDEDELDKDALDDSFDWLDGDSLDDDTALGGVIFAADVPPLEPPPHAVMSNDSPSKCSAIAIRFATRRKVLIRIMVSVIVQNLWMKGVIIRMEMQHECVLVHDFDASEWFTKIIDEA